MFDRVNFDVSLRERRGAIVFRDIFHARFNLRFVFKIHATKSYAGIGRRGQNRHVHPIAAVQADAGKAGGFVQSLLIEHEQIRQNATAIGKPSRIEVLPFYFFAFATASLFNLCA